MRWPHLPSRADIASLGKRTVIVAVSLVAVAGVALGAGFVYLTLRNQTSMAEDVLPANETIAVMHNADGEMIDAVRGITNLLDNAPQLMNDEESAALVRMPDGTTEWVVLRPSQEGGTFEIDGSAQAQDLIRTAGVLLRRDEQYRAMASARTKQDGWIYLADLGENPAVGFAQRVAIQRKGEVMRLILSPSRPSLEAGLERDVIAAFPAPFFVMSVADAQVALQMTKQAMNPDALLLATARLRQWAKDHLGPGISLDRDLAALLRGSATLQLARTTETGAVLGVLTGVLPQNADVDALLGQLHEKFVQGLPKIAHFQRDLGDNLSVSDLRLDDTVVVTQSKSINGWGVRLSSHKELGFILASAWQGNRFMISNDPDALERLVRDRGELPSIYLSTEQAPTGELLAGGFAEFSQMKDVLPSSLPGLVLARFPLPWLPFSRALWTLERKDGVTALELVGVKDDGKKERMKEEKPQALTGTGITSSGAQNAPEGQ